MAADETPDAYLVHQLSTRFRLRVPDRRGEPDYFTVVRERLTAMPGVDEVRVNDITGSILVLHPERPFADLESDLESLALFQIAPAAPAGASGFAPLQSTLSNLNQTMRERSGNGVDLRTLAFIAMLAIALRQIRRGEFLGPALPMLWNAFDLLLKAQRD